MKYIISSKSKTDNIYECSNYSNFNDYLELGWEMVVSHPYIIRLYNTGEINSDDVIVTLPERKFLYSAIFNNVISYNDFLKIKASQSSTIDVAAMVIEQFHKNYYVNKFLYDEKDPNNVTYKFLKEDKEMLQKLDFVDMSYLHQNKKYVCMSVRKRNHDSYRNIDDNWAHNLLNKLLENIENVFLVGFGSEKFADGVRIHYTNLQEFASLCNNQLCKATINTCSGTGFIPSLISKAKKQILIDMGNSYNKNNPILFADCIRISEYPELIVLDTKTMNDFDLILSHIK